MKSIMSKSQIISNRYEFFDYHYGQTNREYKRCECGQIYRHKRKHKKCPLNKVKEIVRY